MRVMLSMPNFHTRALARWHSLVLFALKIRSESTRIEVLYIIHEYEFGREKKIWQIEVLWGLAKVKMNHG